MQRGVVGAGGEAVVGRCVEAGVGVIRRNVGRGGADGDRRREGRHLPAGRGLVRERDRPQQGAAGGPEIAKVLASVLAVFIEPQPGDIAGTVGPELHAELQRGCLVPVGAGRCRLRPDAAGTGLLGLGHPRRRKDEPDQYAQQERSGPSRMPPDSPGGMND